MINFYARDHTLLIIRLLQGRSDFRVEWVIFLLCIREVYSPSQVILTEDFLKFSWVIQANVGRVPRIWSRPLPPTFFPVHYSLVGLLLCHLYCFLKCFLYLQRHTMYSPSALRTRLRHALCRKHYGMKFLCKYIWISHHRKNTGSMVRWSKRQSYPSA
jgi:hypothetical protein